ncbi:hypothetical protein JWG39_03675 [Desulforhopalus vacuolatus]|uniref:hypothetical protein n=1 Tax=Desulforhopalus vacuolatus TaxID=40414 RepID=UPI001964117A|nr:hypothetical protein [Desulforhopalus vacuolatus]MBM9518913.1 hypothetical protein [Desulforhopalus vacuolatus]
MTANPQGLLTGGRVRLSLRVGYGAEVEELADTSSDLVDGRAAASDYSARQQNVDK